MGTANPSDLDSEGARMPSLVENRMKKGGVIPYRPYLGRFEPGVEEFQ